MIFFFSATGNSLYVAKQLSDKPVSIPQVIGQNELVFEDETIGIVCPVFGHEMPPMVKEFVERAKFKTDYFYVLLTYGNRHGGAAELADGLLKKIGIQAAYINTVLMADNFLPAFDMEEQAGLDKNVDGQIEAIKKDIAQRKVMIQPATEADRAAHQEFLARSSAAPADRWKGIYRITEDCVGCGICSKVCPMGLYYVEHGKAAYHTDGCQSCMACVHSCPKKAIQLTIPERNPQARYRNKNIALPEIVEANERKNIPDNG